ncbi:MAG: hypothetical protein FWG33_05010, partial [Oscillospiraceae bacterium]|nr:hypothetical protein [Oscillospiraceae bacterium]
MKKRLLPLLSVLLLYLTACAASTTAEYISDESGIVTADTTSESVTTELTSTTTPQTTETEVTTEEFTTPFPETTESPPTQPPPPAPVAYGG